MKYICYNNNKLVFASWKTCTLILAKSSMLYIFELFGECWFFKNSCMLDLKHISMLDSIVCSTWFGPYYPIFLRGYYAYTQRNYDIHSPGWTEWTEGQIGPRLTQKSWIAWIYRGDDSLYYFIENNRHREAFYTMYMVTLTFSKNFLTCQNQCLISRYAIYAYCV